MNKKTTFKRYVPVPALRMLKKALNEYPPHFSYDIDYFYFILDLFFRIPSYSKDLFIKDNGYLAIASNYFTKYITADYANYTHYLVFNGIIDCDFDNSIDNHICYGYILTRKAIGKLSEIEINPDGNLCKRIKDNIDKNRDRKGIKPHLKVMKKWFKKIEVDMIRANDYLIEMVSSGRISPHQYQVCLYCLNRINEHDFLFKRNKTNNRLDTNLTCIMKELRQFISIKGVNERLVVVDLVNSQPFLLNYIIKLKQQIDKNNLIDFKMNRRRARAGSSNVLNTPSSIRENEKRLTLKPLSYKHLEQIQKCPKLDKEELNKYFALTSWGMIYEYFEKSLGVSREDAKIIFFGIFYSVNTFSNFEEDKLKFKSEFPTIYNMIEHLKKGNHRSFPIELQMIESELFIDVIGEMLYTAGIDALTIHDSFIVKESQLEQTRTIMEKVFEDYIHLVPELKTEYIDPDELMRKIEAENPFRFILKEKFDPYHPKPVNALKERLNNKLKNRIKVRVKNKRKSYSNFELMMKNNLEFRKQNVFLK